MSARSIPPSSDGFIFRNRLIGLPMCACFPEAIRQRGQRSKENKFPDTEIPVKAADPCYKAWSGPCEGNLCRKDSRENSPFLLPADKKINHLYFIFYKQ